MKSIQSHLIGRLTLATVLLLLGGGGALFLSLRHTLLREFDRSLTLRAHALQSLFTQNSAGKLDVDLRVSAMPEFTRKESPEFFSVEGSDGKVVISSSPKLIAAVAGEDRWDTRLPTGQPARALRVWFKPTTDDDEGAAGDETKPAASARHTTELVLTLARDSEPLHQSILGVAVSIAVASLLSSGIAVTACVWIVRGSLKSLSAVASNAAAIDLQKGDAHFEVESLPTELAPILTKFNELLAVQNKALLRERQFSAAVSHELRTPIAELRTAADIALRSPTNLELAIRSARHSQEIAVQLQTLVSTLMSIVTLERSAESIRLTAVELGQVLQQARIIRSEDLRTAELQVVENLTGPHWVLANTPLLSAVLDNLLSNAVQYAPAGSNVVVETSTEKENVLLSVANDQVHLRDGDLENLFDPFWRKDVARNSGQHVGLGLALARTYCNAMNAAIRAELTAAGQLRITVSLKKADRGKIAGG